MAFCVCGDHKLLRFAVIVFLMLGNGPSAVAQQIRGPQPVLRPMSPAPPQPDTATASFFLDVVREIAAGLGLSDLAQSQSAPSDLEVRLWHGFGLFGVHGLIVTRQGPRWSAITVTPGPPQMHPPTRVRYISSRLADTVSWATTWAAVQQLGLERLPPVPLRDPTIMVNDGNSYVMEWRDGNRYRTAVYGNPQVFKTADDTLMQAIADSLLFRAYPKWRRTSR